MSLIGKFAFISSNQYYQKVEITEKITDDVYMIKCLSNEDNNFPNIFLIHIAMLVTDFSNDEGFSPSVYLFNTKEELNTFVTYIESAPDEEKKVLSLVKKEV